MKTEVFTKTNRWLLIALILAMAVTTFAQTTEFTYQTVALKKLVCATNAAADVCKEEK